MGDDVLRSELLSVRDAIGRVVASASAKFVESVDVSIMLGVDTRKSEEQIRGVVSLPHALGMSVSVAVFAKDKFLLEAADSGADIYGGDELIDEVHSGKRAIKVDWCVTTPDFMASVSRVAKILGPRGLMPNPKLGTVTFDVADRVKHLKAGHVVKYRADKSGIVHAKIGSVKFSVDILMENFDSLISALKQAKPVSVKGGYFKSIFVHSTMGKSFRVLMDHKE